MNPSRLAKCVTVEDTAREFIERYGTRAGTRAGFMRRQATNPMVTDYYRQVGERIREIKRETSNT